MLSLYHLPGTLSGEEVLKIYRRDFFILFKKVLFFILLVILPVILFFMIQAFLLPNILSDNLYHPIVLLMTSAYYIFIWLFFFFSFLDYYLDVWIITSERIIDIQQNGFFSRVISEQRLYRIQDVTSEVNGVMATIFKYGNIYVQTAGTKQRFFFHQVSNPDKIRDSIIRLVERSKKQHSKELENN